jgi:hypothetical protein
MTTTDTKQPSEQGMTPDEALEVLKRQAHELTGDHVSDCKCGDCEEIDDALAAHDGLHAHWSRFKVGDEVWLLVARKNANRERRWIIEYDSSNIVTSVRFEDDGEAWYQPELYDPDEWAHTSRCFPTRAEAEAECARRNEKP